MHQAFVVLAHDLDSDDCQWIVRTGATAHKDAQIVAKRYTQREGRWIAFVRPVGDVADRFDATGAPF